MKRSTTFRQLTAGTVFSRPKPADVFKEEVRADKPVLAGCSTPAGGEDGVDEARDGETVRAEYHIGVEGDDIPDPVTSFQDMADRYSVSDIVVRRLKAMGYLKPTPIQMQAVPLMLQGREMICSAPTGSGKTLAFLIPLISHLKTPQTSGFRAIVLAPSRELVKQIHAEFLTVSEGTGLRIHIIKNVKEAAVRFGRKSKGMKDILVTTPNRLLYLLNTDPPSLRLKNLQWLVIDECDKLFEEDFREQLAFIYKACTRSKHLKRAMFSATFSDQLAEWFKMNLDNVVSLIVGGKNCATETVCQRLQFVGSEAGKEIALKNLILNGLDVPVVIFVDHIKAAKLVFKHLITCNINAECIHSDRTQVEREKVVREFREGRIMFLVATELLGRGIDFRAVNTIINYDCPKSATSYIHRIGRTGRAGRSGVAITFYTENDVPRLRAILTVMKKSNYQLPPFLERCLERPAKRQKFKQKAAA